LTATILSVFATVVYYSAKESREKEFYVLLKKEAITKANLLFNANIDKSTLQDIYRSNRKILDEVEVAIYDTGFTLLYHDAVDIDYVKETRQMIDEISEKGEISFYQQDWQVVGLRYDFQDETYIVTATAIDQYGYNKLDSLLRTIIVLLTISILVIYITGRFLSKKAFEPVKEMTDKAAAISATNLDLRLSDNGKKDELSQLAITFNEMLNRLESSFETQKHFVSNISHELRTPLAAIITELELSIDKDRNIEQYKAALQNTLSDAKKLVRLSNNLLDLAKASYDPAQISFKQTRIDEILLDARQQIQQANSDYKIDIHFENDFENDSQISVCGNEYLLKVAFANLFENGCKFSRDKSCVAVVSFSRFKARYPDSPLITLDFRDKGAGISEADLKNIFIPFYRGENKNIAQGNGIGLSLTQKIIGLHSGNISVESERNSGTIFRVELPAIGD
jgi:signal transduction histidine kinase